MENENHERMLLEKLVTLREKYKLKQNKKNQLEYKKVESDCIMMFSHIVDSRTKKYRGFANYEDLCQDGKIALCRALQTYNPNKGDFYWWCNKYIKTKISREANRHSTIKIPLKHAKLVQPYKVSQLPIIIDGEPSALDRIANDEAVILIRSAVEKLPEDQRRVITLHYELGGGSDNRRDLYSIGKICDRLNISRMSCIKLLTEAKKTLRRELVDLF
ncbi:sigma-70 family RNA polymerase sigma factor [Candidatus Pacearchaeota archaeon]|nr:sigma-70 family RNA polymerase sigma factor [Candidatus Pacearchaeota archaeon]